MAALDSMRSASSTSLPLVFRFFFGVSYVAGEAGLELEEVAVADV